MSDTAKKVLSGPVVDSLVRSVLRRIAETPALRDLVEGSSLAINPFPTPTRRCYRISDRDALRSDWLRISQDFDVAVRAFTSSMEIPEGGDVKRLEEAMDEFNQILRVTNTPIAGSEEDDDDVRRLTNLMKDDVRRLTQEAVERGAATRVTD